MCTNPIDKKQLISRPLAVDNKFILQFAIFERSANYSQICSCVMNQEENGRISSILQLSHVRDNSKVCSQSWLSLLSPASPV